MIHDGARFDSCSGQPEWRPIDRYYEDISLRKIEAGPSETFMILWNETVNKIISPSTVLPPVSVAEKMCSRVNAHKAGWAGPWGGKWSPDIRRVRAVIIVDEEE
jgi:hypothetical protein